MRYEINYVIPLPRLLIQDLKLQLKIAVVHVVISLLNSYIKQFIEHVFI